MRGEIVQVLQTHGCRHAADHRVDHLEHVELHVRMTHSHRGDVNIVLQSPMGTK